MFFNGKMITMATALFFALVAGLSLAFTWEDRRARHRLHAKQGFLGVDKNGGLFLDIVSSGLVRRVIRFLLKQSLLVSAKPGRQRGHGSARYR